MAKYKGWTLGDTEALLNIMGGTDVARAVLRGELKFTVEAVPQPRPPARPSLFGKVWRTVTVPAYRTKDFEDAVRLGKFDNMTSLGDTICLFCGEQVGLDKPVKIDLVEFDRHWRRDEVIAWGKQQGKSLIETVHLMGIAIKLPDEQRERPILGLNSVRGGGVLYLRGDSDWRYLVRHTVNGYWPCYSAVGFLSE